MRSSLAIDELSAHHALTTLPEVWLDLAHGRLSADEAAAAMEGLEPPELVERSKALFRPRSPEEEARRLEALLEAHFPAPARRRVLPPWVRATLASAAAAAALVLLWPAPPAFEQGYAISMSPGLAEQRAAPTATTGVHRYSEGQRIEIRLKPQGTVKGEVGVVAFALAEGRVTPLEIEPEVKEHGVIVIAGTPEALGLSVGRWQIVVVVGPPEHLPEPGAGVHDDAKAPYDVQRAEVEIVRPPDPAAP
jgi:hypothetical protein